jgi:L-methionine (R)-S-oxide reductase
MAETIEFTRGASREAIYSELVPQVESLISAETDLVANMANVAAVLREAFGFFWVGFYIEKGGQLVLGPFQGPVACTRIGIDKGVCGHAYTTRDTVIVPNVDEFPGHIACASASRSEIVLPFFDSAGAIIGVLDVDSDRLDDFSDTDAAGLRRILKALEASV